jgi:peptidoglycan/xylan/chitin deacetylase (PgdA/CDA1 family)
VGLIVLYHRIVDLPSDPQLLGVAPQHFAEHLQVLRTRARPLPLAEMVDMLREKRLPRRAVAVTFDDGYADNLCNAKPLLEQYDVPATVFVTTGHVGHQREFWWDELDRLLLQPGLLPPTLELRLNGRTWRWELGEPATYTTTEYERHRDWHIERQEDPTTRQRLYRDLYQLLHSLAETERQQMLDRLFAWSGTAPAGRPTHRTLSRDEVVRLAEGDLVEVGAHTVTHAVLAALPISAQQEQIRQSRVHLEDMLNRPVISFAYPHGSYTQETLAVVRDAGFTCACSSDTTVVRRGADHFRLPRVVARDWDGETFARWLEGWFAE